MTRKLSRRTRHARCAAAAFLPSVLALCNLAQAQATGPTAERIVVTASRTPQPASSVLADVSVIDRTEIERAGVVGVADLLGRLPGLEFTRNGGPGAVTGVYIRGHETRHTALYIDGVRVDAQATGGALWEQIPLDQIDRIEVQRGPAAAIYGSDAVAGVVQLFTRRGQGAARPSVSLTAGSNNTVQGQVGVSGSTGAMDYSLSASHARSDGFDASKPGAFGHNDDRDGYERTSAQGRLGVQLSTAHRIDASLLASKLTSGYDGSATTDDQNHHTLRTGSLAWQGRWNDDATTRLQLGRTYSAYESQPSYYRTETTLTDTTLLHEQRIAAGQQLTGTLERRSDELFNPATAFGAAFGGKRHQDGLALGWRGSFGAHGLQAHVRRDDDSEFGVKNTGSAAWGWTFAPQWRATVSGATSFRAPTLYQRYSEFGNAQLVPEAGRNVELALRWAATGSEASVTTWRNKIQDLIVFGSAGPCLSPFGCYQNVGRAEIKGVTIAGSTALGQMKLRASADWHDPRNADTGLVLQRRARRLGTLGVDSSVAGWTWGAEVQASGPRFENAANTQVLAGYALLNVYVGTTLMPGLTLQARVDNLADQRYELARNYATPGRNGQLSLRWSM